jgi:hypothetical protein
VTVASWLMYVAAAALSIGAAAQFGLAGAVRRAAEQDQANAAMAGTVSYLVVALLAVVWLLPAVGLAVLGLLNGKGKKAARIVTWVVGGLTLCCCGFQTFSSTVTAISGTDAAGSTISSDTGTNVMALSIIDGMPSWYQPTLAFTSLAVVLTVFVAMILLAVPASNAYFRPAPAQWVWEPVPMPPPVEPPPVEPPRSPLA